jgi:homoserine kinase
VEAGALGCGISGSGPTIFALCTEKEIGFRVGKSNSGGILEVKIEE